MERSVRRKIIRITFVYATLALLLGAPLLAYGLGYSMQQLQYIVLVVTPLVFVSVVIADAYVMVRHYRPIRAGLEALRDPEPDRSRVRVALVQLINLPVLTLTRILGVHTPVALAVAALALPLVNVWFDLGLQPWQIISTLGVAVTVGISHGILEYFAVQRELRPTLLGLREVAGDLTPEQEQHIIPNTIGRRLLVISVLMTFIPFTVLGISLVYRFYSLAGELGLADPTTVLRPMAIWIAMLVAVVSLLTLTIALLMSRDIQTSVGRMVDAMRRVQEGDLATRMSVTTSDEFAALYRGFNRMAQGLLERRRLHEAFGRYVSPTLAGKVMSDPSVQEGKIVTASVLFADIRGFTTLSEKMPAEDIVEMLNRYFGALEPEIKAEGGWINKFLGDGIMVVFGAPVAYEGHAERAVRAALSMLSALERFNAEQRLSASPTLEIGIGIDCGEMIAGTIGSPDRVEYTVIGDPVNVAARVESLTKQFGVPILVTERVHSLVESIVEAESLPAVQIRGKSVPVRVFSVLRVASEPVEYQR